MRLMRRYHGAVRLVPMSASHCYSAKELRTMLHGLMTQRGQLLLDFCGETVPLCSPDEVSLCASLLAVYHNSCIRDNIQVSCI